MSFLKAPGYQDGHAHTPIPDEQLWLTKEINALMHRPTGAAPR